MQNTKSLCNNALPIQTNTRLHDNTAQHSLYPSCLPCKKQMVTEEISKQTIMIEACIKTNENFV